MNHYLRSFIFGGSIFLLPYGNSDGDRSAVLRNAVDANVAMMAAQVSLADAQAETGAFASLGSEERFEDVRQDVR